MARLYTNENFPLQVVEELRRLEHDVLTTQEADNAGKALPDAEVLAFAIQEGRTLVTLNRRHFIRLHRDQPNHHGIVVCTYDADFASQAKRIHEALGDSEWIAKQLFRVYRPALQG
jgi:predicted nucleic acid-binding protein